MTFLNFNYNNDDLLFVNFEKMYLLGTVSENSFRHTEYSKTIYNNIERTSKK
jgi:hypothetical protein